MAVQFSIIVEAYVLFFEKVRSQMSNEGQVRKTIMINTDLCDALVEQKGDMTFTELFNRLAEAQVTKVIDVTTETSTPEMILASGMNQAIADRISAEAELMRAQAAALRKTEDVSEDAPVAISIDEADVRQAVECIVAAVVEEQHAEFVSRIAGTLGEAEQMVNAMCERLNIQCNAAANLVEEEPDEDAQENMEVDDESADSSYDSGENVVSETDATEADAVEADERGEEPSYDDSKPAEAEGSGSVEDPGDAEDDTDVEEDVEAEENTVVTEEGDDSGDGDADGSGEGDVDVVTGDGGSSDGTAGGRELRFESTMSDEVASVTGDAGIEAIIGDIEGSSNGYLNPDSTEFSDSESDQFSM